MKKYVKEFLHRGMMFGGFGPIIVGIIYVTLENALADFSLTGFDVFLAIVSTYLLAFIQAGISVFNQIEHWHLAKALFAHFATLYLAYVLCYLVNTWIPFEPMVLLIFTAIFTAGYFVVWTIVYFTVKATSKKLNAQL